MYLAVLGRQPVISIAELEALFFNVKRIYDNLATFDAEEKPDISRLGGSLKIAEKLEVSPLEYLSNLEPGKITFGISDWSRRMDPRSTLHWLSKLKRKLVQQGRSVRTVWPNTAAGTITTASSLHNGFSGENPRKVELIKVGKDWYKVIGVQDIDAYAARDQKRPARDAKVGMLPPKLAQILVNLCGDLKPGSRILDPFCGTGVLLQEAMLMGYKAYGTDLSERMIDYSKRNFEYLGLSDFELEAGDATSFKWNGKIDAVACEGFLGRPMVHFTPRVEIDEQKQICREIILGFLENLYPQIESGTPVVIAAPAWLEYDTKYSRLMIIDEIQNMGYNVDNKSRRGLLYYRRDQIVARDIIILRKK